MDIQSEKLALIQWLAGISDSRIISLFQTLKQTTEEAQNTQPTSAEHMAVEQGLQSIASGKTVPNEEVSRLTKEKYPNLFGRK